MPLVTGAAIAANDDVEKKIKGIGPYMKAHWKELLALVLAAIPALFIVFHKGARDAAQQAVQPILDAIPGGAGSPGTPAGPSGGGDPGTSIPSAPSAPSPPAAAAPSSTLGISVNGSNPVSVAPPPKAPPPQLPAPTTASSIVARLGGNAPGFRDTAQQVSTQVPIFSGSQLPGGLVQRILSRISVAPPPPPPPPSAEPVSIPRPTRTGAQSF